MARPGACRKLISRGRVRCWAALGLRNALPIRRQTEQPFSGRNAHLDVTHFFLTEQAYNDEVASWPDRSRPPLIPRVSMVHLCRTLFVFLNSLVVCQSHCAAGVFTAPVTNIVPAETGDHLVREFDFEYSFSQVESLEFEFVMPNGYDGVFATTGNSSWSRGLHVVIHGSDDVVQFTDNGLAYPIMSSLFATFYEVRPSESAGFYFRPLITPFHPPIPDHAFRDFVNSGNGRLVFVDIYRSALHPLSDHVVLGTSTSYAIPEEITLARITVAGTPTPEPSSVLLFFACSAWLAVGKRR
jgi:hypothetical protein